jgi:hypothetical protein
MTDVHSDINRRVDRSRTPSGRPTLLVPEMPATFVT